MARFQGQKILFIIYKFREISWYFVKKALMNYFFYKKAVNIKTRIIKSNLFSV